MTMNRIIRGGMCFRVSKEKICAEIKVDLPQQHMLKTAASYIHKHLQHQKCYSLTDQLIIPKRKVSLLYVKKPQIGIYNASLDKIIELYNRLPPNVRVMTMRQFKIYLLKNKVKPS